MKNFYNKTKIFAQSHKVWSALIALVILYGGYSLYQKLTGTGTETRYTTAIVTKGTIIASLSGSGQVSALNQIDVKPKVSGDVVSVNVASGQVVKAGVVIARLDATDALKAVRDAEISVETARLTYDKLVAPPDALSSLQSHDAVVKAEQAKMNATADLKKTYDDGFNNVSNAFLDLPNIISGLNSMLYMSDRSLGADLGQANIDYYESYAQMKETVSGKAQSFKDDVDSKYKIARASYDKTFAAYKATSRASDTATVESLIQQTYDTARLLADAVKSTNNLIQLYEDQTTLQNKTYKPLADTHLSVLNGYTAKLNSFLTNLLNSTTSISNDKTAIANADTTIQESNLSLQKLDSGADPLDIRNAKILITQKQNALSDAYTTLSYYTIRAPFDGIIAAVNVKKGDSVSGGTAAATIVTTQQIAELSLNEVDIAKVKLGQKATMTFDAVPDLTITGKVSEVDTIGTVSQGVATYGVKIAFDTQDDRIKPGMTVSSVIIIDVKTDTLIVPSGAVKGSGTAFYVETFAAALPSSSGTQGSPSATPPSRMTVTTGISDDTQTEIVSGLKEGDIVVTKTVSGLPTTTTTSSAPSLFGGGGGSRALRPGGG